MPECFYHITSRGNRKEPLFLNHLDYRAFFHILQKIHEKIPLEFASFCIMSNHFHLQLRSQQASISKVMALLNKRYANYYNTRYRLTGHVFENRFFSSLIEDRAGMLQVSKYIHLNPVKAGMVKKPEDYAWSSYRFYHQEIKNNLPSYINIYALLDLFEGTLAEKQHQYNQGLSITLERMNDEQTTNL
ncbi:transposase [Bacillus sp. SD088]|uniref:transposase n=1 Tax=Bacillus sp. SD088 TaxID=2782012 RepID=UPI001A964A5A|nr:transposase [Bacillus sp. SD088]